MQVCSSGGDDAEREAAKGHQPVAGGAAGGGEGVRDDQGLVEGQRESAARRATSLTAGPSTVKSSRAGAPKLP